MTDHTRPIAYFDCFSGISGDMTLGALIDLGLSAEWLENTLRQKLKLDGFELKVQRVQYHGIAAHSVEVRVTDEPAERDYATIRRIIDDSSLEAGPKEKAQAIFSRLAHAEARIHGGDVDHIHFHEVGGMDAIVDVIGTVAGLEKLGLNRIAASKIATGRGLIRSSHGILPLPAPATLAILKDIPVYGTGIENELVTPTGAAIIAVLAETFGPMPEMIVDRIGYGAGSRDLAAQPNLLRVITGRTKRGGQHAITVIETCIDDMNPEIYGYLMERLFENGALDVAWIPVFMKKNRPGTKIEVICRSDAKDRLIRCILSETTTTGLRYHEADRYVLPRDFVSIETPYGTLSVKRITDPNGNYRLVPEYEDCSRIARDQRISIRTVYDTILKAAQEQNRV